MTREEFIQVLDKKGYSYEIDRDKIVVTGEDHADLVLLKTLPPGVEFKNEGDVYLYSLGTLPPGVVFKNKGNVSLALLNTLHPGVEFRNGGNVYFRSLEKIPPGVEFRNEGIVDLHSLTGGEFHNWSGNIEGVDNKRLLNLMIKQGVFI